MSHTPTEDGKISEFDIGLVLESFKKCGDDDGGQLTLDDYIAGYIELNKFFGLLGTVFGFVGSDVHQKLVQLQCLRKGGAGDSYTTVERMIRYEKEAGVLESDKAANGCRTLLRLHRALAFIADFMRELHDRPDEQKMSSVCQACYKRTLAAHHPWLVQKGALLAMHMLGTRGDIVEKAVGGDSSDKEKHKDTLLECIETMQRVFDATQRLYEEHDLLELP